MVSADNPSTPAPTTVVVGLAVTGQTVVDNTDVAVVTYVLWDKASHFGWLEGQAIMVAV